MGMDNLSLNACMLARALNIYLLSIFIGVGTVFFLISGKIIYGSFFFLGLQYWMRFFKNMRSDPNQ